MEKERKSVSHSGDLGDIVYGCSALYEMGGPFDFIYTPSEKTRVMANPELARSLAPLLKIQPYIGDVYFSDRSAATYSLDSFRSGLRPGISLADAQRSQFGLAKANECTPWLRVDRAESVCPVILSRSSRYQNFRFPWNRVVEAYGRGALGFVGTASDHHALCGQLGVGIPHVRTDTLLDLASVIAGAQLFIGNQSCPYAIAEGLKVPTVQEVFRAAPDCIFARPGAVYGWDEHAEFPTLLPLKDRTGLTPMPEYYSAFGEDRWIDLNIELPEMGIAIEFGKTPYAKFLERRRWIVSKAVTNLVPKMDFLSIDDPEPLGVWEKIRYLRPIVVVTQIKIGDRTGSEKIVEEMGIDGYISRNASPLAIIFQRARESQRPGDVPIPKISGVKTLEELAMIGM